MNVIVIGGGPAGMKAAITAAQNGYNTTLIEQNEKLGKKLYITGKGRCNITNACDSDTLFSNITHNPKFLHSALNVCNPDGTIAFFEDNGLKTKIERGARVFPASDKSSDVIRTLNNKLRECGVNVLLNTKVLEICVNDNKIQGVHIPNKTLNADFVILATGGVSYPSTGSTGDGYTFAKLLGHTVLTPMPSLVPFDTEEEWPSTLSGLTLKNVKLSVYRGKKLEYKKLGELLFAHFGVTGPLVLSASSYIADNPRGAKLYIDLKPALSVEQLDARLLNDIAANNRMNISNAFASLLPKKLLPVVFSLCAIDPNKPAANFTKAHRNTLISVLKALPLTVKSTRPFSEAVITRGGINIKEVNASTLESRLIQNLYFAGEVLDVDAQTGGFNLQIAWSTGTLAGLLKNTTNSGKNKA